MTVRIKKRHPALKHAGYCASKVLPGESAAEFEKLHQELISEWTPNGALEDETVATMAHLLWRKRNRATFRIAERARQRVKQIQDTMVQGMDYVDCDVPKSDKADNFDKIFAEKLRAAEIQAREELGELYGLVEMGEEATVDYLMRDLEVQDRLDAMIDKCLKRLLFLRGLKSISSASASSPRERLSGPSKAA